VRGRVGGWTCACTCEHRFRMSQLPPRVTPVTALLERTGKATQCSQRTMRRSSCTNLGPMWTLSLPPCCAASHEAWTPPRSAASRSASSSVRCVSTSRALRKRLRTQQLAQPLVLGRGTQISGTRPAAFGWQIWSEKTRCVTARYRGDASRLAAARRVAVLHLTSLISFLTLPSSRRNTPAAVCAR